MNHLTKRWHYSFFIKQSVCIAFIFPAHGKYYFVKDRKSLSIEADSGLEQSGQGPQCLLLNICIKKLYIKQLNFRTVTVINFGVSNFRILR